MKRKIFIPALILAMVLLLAGCGCEHEWAEANCETPKTCTLCQETEGAPLGHTWAAATCSAPKTCETCAATEGEALGHTWVDATCLVPKQCSTCHETEGEALGHSWLDATTDAPKTCENCATTEGSKLDVDPRFTTESTKHLYGKWSCEVTIPGEILGTTGYIDEIPCTLYYEFTNTGEMLCDVELHDRFAFLDGYKKLLSDAMYELLAAQGVGKEDIDDAMQLVYGMTMEEYLDTSIESMDMDELFGAFSSDMVYYVTDGKLHAALSWYNEFEASDYTLENGILIIEDDKMDEESEPFQWTKVEE